MTHWLLDPLAYPFMIRALITGVLVGISCALMGSYLLVRRWSLMGDAISHAVLPGVAFAYLLGGPYFIGALVTGLLTSLGIGFVERNSRIKSDAAMGILFTGAFALGLVMLSVIRGNRDVYHMLFGNILGVAVADMWLTALSAALVVALVLLFYKELHLWSFDAVTAQVTGIPVRGLHYMMMFLLSVTIVASLASVGVVLVIAMLITPAATAYLLTHRFQHMMVLAAAIGSASAVVGLYLSYYMNVASGGTMVLVATTAFVLAFFFSPSQGMVWRRLHHTRAARRIALDDSLKALHELAGQNGPATVDDVARLTGDRPGAALSLLRRLQGQGLARPEAGGFALTAAGVSQARALIRSHRLWERYLTDEAGLPWDAVHDAAHELEHRTPPEMADRLAEALGHPEHDPHGAPIPTREGVVVRHPDVPLARLGPGAAGVITYVADEDPDLLKRLHAAGLVPGARLEVDQNTPAAVAVTAGGRRHTIASADAAQIRVRSDQS